MREGNGSVMLTPPRGTRRRWRRCGISRSAATDKCSFLRCWQRRISGRSGVCSYCWRRSWSQCTAHDYWSSLKTMDDENIGSLRRMVQDLKEMDAAWRESVDGPTPAEQSLYGLILGHVFSEIFLFHHEKYSRLHDTCEDEVEWLVKGSNWEYTMTNFPTSDFQSSGPKGFIFALIFEELSDFQSLLSIWKRRFSDITIARYSQEESMDVSLGTDSLYIKVDELKTVDERQDLEVEKKLRHDLYVIDACKSVISNNRPAKKTRYEYLTDIFSAFESMGYSSRSLDIVEFRMYTRILEHLQSYKWLAYAEAKPVEIDLFYELQSDVEEETVISESDTWTREKKSREQYLQEIVSTVDAIESEYFLLRPSLKELLLYDKIERRAIRDIRQSSCCYLKQGQMEGKTGSAEEVALARRVLKSIFRREVELASGLEKEIVDTLGLIFARCMPTETKLTKWLVEHMEDAESDMKTLATNGSRGFKLFDSALSSMLEIRELYGKLLEKLCYANWFVYCSLDSYKLFQVPLVEGLTSLPWLEATSP